ncbi:hypothetical protein TWF281_010351 [Arthrobotrys megalospora]
MRRKIKNSSQQQQPGNEYMADDSLYTQSSHGIIAQLQPSQPVFVPLTPVEPKPTDVLKDGTDGWENPNPCHRFNPNGPFNFSPQVPKGTSSHPESIKRRKIVGKKAGLAAALFRLKESGRSRKRHRKDALRKKEEFLNASEAEQKRMLAEADKTSKQELAAKIAACTKAWNELSPEAQRAHMARAADVEAQDPVEASPVPEAVADARPTIRVRVESVPAPKHSNLVSQILAGPVNQQAQDRALAPVALSTRSRTSGLRLPADISDIDQRLVAEATSKNMPFVDGLASHKTVAKRSASEAGLPEKVRPGSRSKLSSPKKKRVGPIEFEAVERASQVRAAGQSSSPYGLRSRIGDITATEPPIAIGEIDSTSISRAIARASGIPGGCPLPPRREREAEPVESSTPRRSCRTRETPKLVNERAASAIMQVMGLTGGQGGVAGTVIPPRPLEQVRDQDLNAKSDRDALRFMESDYYKRWKQSQKKQ